MNETLFTYAPDNTSVGTAVAATQLAGTTSAAAQPEHSPDLSPARSAGSAVASAPAGHVPASPTPRPAAGRVGEPASGNTAPAEVFVLHGEDAATLAAAAGALARRAPSLSAAELRGLAIQFGRDVCPPGRHRLGIVARDPRELAARAQQAATLVPTAGRGRLLTRPGIFAGHDVAGRVVLLFPGLGTGQDASRPPDPVAPAPLFSVTDPEAVQPAVLHAELAGLRWLDRLGVRADAAIGHSLGEIAALVWAGSLTEAEAARLVAQRSAVISASGERAGAMLSVAAGRETGEALCAGTGAVLAADNGPESCVLAGPAASVADVARRAAAEGIRTAALNVSHAFHSPAMAGCVAPLRAVLADIRLSPPGRRLVSTVTGRALTAHDDLAGLLCTGLTSPVRFAAALAAVTAAADLLCETGPGHALATLAAAAGEVPAVSLESRTDGDLGPAQAAAALFAAGAVHSLAPLTAGRTGPVVDLTPRLAPAAGAASPRDVTAKPDQAAASDEAGRTDGGQHDGNGPAEVQAADVIPIVPRTGASGSWPAGPEPRGRFLDGIVTYRPGAELVADSRLTPDRDPYLADYRIEGWAVLPAVLGLEAMAQAASAVAGGPMRRAEQVSFGAPVVFQPDATVLRVSARRAGSCVLTVLRSWQAGEWTEHGQAVFLPAPAGAPSQDGERSQSPGWRAAEAAEEILDGSDLYGPVCFQAGRFRRVAFLPEVSSRRCRALVRGDDGQPWFGGTPQAAGVPLVLGSPGVNDATLHALQACFPLHRVLPGGCDAVVVSGRQTVGAVEVTAVQRPASRAGTDPRQVQGQDEYVWDVTAVDGTGEPLASWTGLRLRDAGPLPGTPALPAALLGVHLERGATALGLDPALRIVVRHESPAMPGQPAGWAPAAPASSRRGWVSAQRRDGGLGELSLRLRAAAPAGCAWLTAGLEPDGASLAPAAGNAEFAAVAQRLRDDLAEPGPAVRARIAVAAECLASAGRPAAGELTVDSCHGDGWALLRAGDALIACTSVRVAGVPAPVVIAIMSGAAAQAAGAA